MKLTIGIRCVQRSPSTLQRTIQSLSNAELSGTRYYFVDGEYPNLSEMSGNGIIIHRTQRSGAWPNFYLSLAEMYLREPHSDLYLLLEDDVIFCRDIGPYLQHWYQRLEVASLFTSERVENRIRHLGPGFHCQNPGWNVASGGQAWVFSNRRLREFLQSDFVVNYRRTPPQEVDPKHYRKDGLYHTDSVVGRFCQEAGCGIQYHYPSLVQHIGHDSFMFPNLKSKQDIRYSKQFPGEDFSAMTLHQQQQHKVAMSPEKCVILVPVGSHIERGCENGLLELEKRGYPVWRVRGYAAIDQGRNQMATDALRQGLEETMWIDSDVEFHADDVEKLRRHNLPITSAIYPRKGQRSLASHVMPGTEKIQFGKNGGLLEIKYAATGFLHVRRQAYADIQSKLSLPTCNEAFGSPMIPFFQPMVIDDAKRGSWYLAEDFAFSERARQAGFQVYADTSIRLKHIGSYGYTWEDAGSNPQRFENYTFHVS